MSASTTPVAAAIVLAAGEGSRLRAAAPSKPLARVGGRPLVDHALEGLAAAGIARAVVVTGYRADELEAHLAGRAWPLTVATARVEDWTLPNGVSALAGGRALGADTGAPALLVMCDHLVDPALYRRVAQAGPGPGLRLGIDRRPDAPGVDMDDVTRVRTTGDAITAIGKGLEPFDAFDTGVFAVAAPFFAALAGLAAPSITEGVRVLAAAGRATVLDVGALSWIDVDDPAALSLAEGNAAALAERNALETPGDPAPAAAEAPALPLASAR